jgi:hypothetical protein
MISFLLGISLYHLKHKVSTIEKDLRHTRNRILETRESLHILRAEWGFLNNPHRLQKLNEQHLHLKPVNAKQISSLEGMNDERMQGSRK